MAKKLVKDMDDGLSVAVHAQELCKGSDVRLDAFPWKPMVKGT